MPENLVETYGWKTAETTHAGAYIAPRILEIIKEIGAKRVLDLGSGNGALCSVLAASGYQVVGVEYDLGGVEIARAAHRDIPFYNFGVQSNPADLLAQEPAFDAVISTEVIEHLFSPHLLPLYANAVLMQKGYLVVTTPYHGYLKNLALAVLGKWDAHLTALWHGGHIKFWSRSTLTQLLEANGFKVVGFSGVGRCPWLWKSMVVVAQKI